MKTSTLIAWGGLTLSLLASPAFSYLLPVEQILRNNTDQRKYVRRLSLHQQIDFFKDPQISCVESIYFKDYKTIRIDYRCNHHRYTLLQHDGKRIAIYNKQLHDLEPRPVHPLLALFLVREPEALFESMAHDRFVTAEKVAPETIEHHSEKEWHIQADVSLVRLSPIQRQHDKKMEKNVCFLVISPEDSNLRMWIEKDIFLPQLIHINGKKIIFKNYTEVTDENPKHPHFFRYPQHIEFLDNDAVTLAIDPHLDQVKLNPTFESDFFSAKKIASSQSGSFPDDSPVKAILETFIAEFR